jgi:P2 family phage contractile tail tube protein
MMVAHKALGMKGQIELPSGFDKMELTIKWNSFYPETFKKFATPYKAVRLQIRAVLKIGKAAIKLMKKPLVIYATVLSKGFPLGNFKSNDNVEFESDLACTQIKMEYNGSL